MTAGASGQNLCSDPTGKDFWVHANTDGCPATTNPLHHHPRWPRWTSLNSAVNRPCYWAFSFLFKLIRRGEKTKHTQLQHSTSKPWILALIWKNTTKTCIAFVFTCSNNAYMWYKPCCMNSNIIQVKLNNKINYLLNAEMSNVRLTETEIAADALKSLVWDMQFHWI